MKKQDLINLVIGLAVIGMGINLLNNTGTYSYRNRMYVQFVQSPIKEIVGIGCVVWGLYLTFVIFRRYLKQNKPKE